MARLFLERSSVVLKDSSDMAVLSVSAGSFRMQGLLLMPKVSGDSYAGIIQLRAGNLVSYALPTEKSGKADKEAVCVNLDVSIGNLRQRSSMVGS